MEDRNFKGFIKNKNFTKTVVLINDKKCIKNVFLNLDMSTFAFGFIPSLLRKKYDAAAFILILQILNFFIISFPFSILTNFAITGIAAIVTAKDYLNYLIDEKNFIPYAIWKDINSEDKYVEKQIILKSKRSESVVIFSSIFIVITISFSLIYAYKDLISGTATTNNKEIVEDTTTNYNTQMSIKNYAVIAMKDDIVDSVLILNSNANNDLDGVIYPGNIQIQLHSTTDELNKLVDINNIDTLKESFKSNFNIEIQNFVVINKEDDKEDISFYQDLLSRILKVHENDIDNRIRNLEEKYSDLEELKIKEFYNSFKDKDVNISELKYDTVLLGDIVESKILESLGLLDRVNYEFITVDKSILQNNEEVKSINAKYDEYLKAQKEKETEKETLDKDNDESKLNNEHKEETITPPVSGGQTDGTTKPPVNNGQTGEVVPPVNDGQTGGSTEPPVEDVKPPTNNEGDGESIKPSGDSGNIDENENINNQINNNTDNNIN